MNIMSSSLCLGFLVHSFFWRSRTMKFNLKFPIMHDIHKKKASSSKFSGHLKGVVKIEREGAWNQILCLRYIDNNVVAVENMRLWVKSYGWMNANKVSGNLRIFFWLYFAPSLLLLCVYIIFGVKDLQQQQQ